MMKRIFTIGLAFLVILCTLLAGCGIFKKTTVDNANPTTLYQQNNSIDMLIYDGVAFVNASDLDWVAALDLNIGQQLGTIKRSNVTREFVDFDATIIDTGIIIYSSNERKDFILANIDGDFIPYYMWVEG